MLNRILFGVILIVSAFIFQWWISLVLSIIGLFYFSNLYEVIVVGIIIDSLYGEGIEIPMIADFDFIFTVTMIVLFVVIYKLKSNLLISR